MTDTHVQNIGVMDRCARTFLGAICLAVYFITPGLSYILALVGILLIITVILGTCPAYVLLGFNTTGSKTAGVQRVAAKAAKASKKRARKRRAKKR